MEVAQPIVVLHHASRSTVDVIRRLPLADPAYNLPRRQAEVRHFQQAKRHLYLHLLPRRHLCRRCHQFRPRQPLPLPQLRHLQVKHQRKFQAQAPQAVAVVRPRVSVPQPAPRQ